MKILRRVRDKTRESGLAYSKDLGLPVIAEEVLEATPSRENHFNLKRGTCRLTAGNKDVFELRTEI